MALKTHVQSRCISSNTSQVHHTFARKATMMTRLQPESHAPALIVGAARVDVIFVTAVVIEEVPPKCECLLPANFPCVCK